MTDGDPDRDACADLQDGGQDQQQHRPVAGKCERPAHDQDHRQTAVGDQHP